MLKVNEKEFFEPTLIKIVSMSFCTTDITRWNIFLTFWTCTCSCCWTRQTCSWHMGSRPLFICISWFVINNGRYVIVIVLNFDHWKIFFHSWTVHRCRRDQLIETRHHQIWKSEEKKSTIFKVIQSLSTCVFHVNIKYVARLRSCKKDEEKRKILCAYQNRRKRATLKKEKRREEKRREEKKREEKNRTLVRRVGSLRYSLLKKMSEVWGHFFAYLSFFWSSSR